ncbi:MarC family protein [Kordiimonas aquimaris]|uniref:MarC family protein n=1 Tax=Kordiimonas aquimaris TaxID=707591 RepID=UPI0021D03E24|nr:MarC family protein [Kordiimonas aquimaris]
MYETFISAFVALFVIIDPPGIAPVFASLTNGTPAQHQRRMAVKGTIIALFILIFFAFFGRSFLALLGISIDALRIAGGLMLFIIALEMVFEKRHARKQESAEKMDDYFEDISVFPIALPLLAGPGAITTVMLQVADAGANMAAQLVVTAALGAVMVVTLIVFLASGPVMKLMGPTVNTILTRLLGVILAALATQFVLDGLRNSFIG